MQFHKESIKSYPITSYLSSKGIEPIKQVGKELVYLSPFRTERTPSFFVNPIINGFYDHGDGVNGDVIKLVMELEKCSYKQALEQLSEREVITPSFSFSGSIKSDDGKSSFNIKGVRELTSKGLIYYLESRSISLQVARTYLKEIRYSIGDKEYYCLGFPNDKGGFELRSKYFKGKTDNAISTIAGKDGKVNLFEGFFDFLSACEYYHIHKPIYTTIVLNSVVNLEWLRFNTKSNVINCHLDNDQAGQKARTKLIERGFTINDIAKELYPNCNDFNEFLTQNRNTPKK